MATAATQKRWLTANKSKLHNKNLDYSIILRKDDAWDQLDAPTRQRLYDLLPPRPDGEPHDINVNPLKCPHEKYIRRAIKSWQEDLIDGKEAKAWRESAIQAGKDRDAGLWDEFREAEREKYWGAREDEPGNGVVDGEDELMGDGRGKNA
ncbi:unnamed protein product [Zymoseptoria tritici ST99CH_1E4]|uniref:ASX DEUBAD domain-containing protein n=1 Tax=Zymoseptoria tritici ST99CH_1E4 TaxID=1276532 RepID=A0A2H1FZU6_ZYMTR|nr:unnamed protein product [Zymoseptoria tritici ST99CH_1E4]